MDVRPGGRYEIAFTTPDGEEHRVFGIYQEVVPLHRLVFNWAWQSTPDRVSLVTVELQPTAGGTELRFAHQRFFDIDARDNHQRGWAGTFVKLDALLKGGTAGRAAAAAPT
jgi:uncharacterized protein YndB with AHSA1/START domain